MGLSIAALAAATSIADADVFEIEQPGLSVKLTRSQLAALLSPDPALYSGLTGVSVVNDIDLFQVEQAGVIKKLTKLELADLVGLGYITVDQTILKLNGDVVPYDGSNYVTGPTPRWRVVPQAAYTEAAPTTSSTITFAGGGPTDGINLKGGQWFSVGSPVRVVVNGTLTYYGICTAVTDTLLTISGAALPTWVAIASLSVGTPDMVKHVSMRSATTGYGVAYPAVVTKGCTHNWKGPTGYLCSYSCAHMNTSSTMQVLIRCGSTSYVSNPGVIPAAGTGSTYGAFVDSALGTLQQTKCQINDGDKIQAITSPVVAAADYLIVCMTFVVP